MGKFTENFQNFLLFVCVCVCGTFLKMKIEKIYFDSGVREEGKNRKLLQVFFCVIIWEISREKNNQNRNSADQ